MFDLTVESSIKNTKNRSTEKTSLTLIIHSTVCTSLLHKCYCYAEHQSILRFSVVTYQPSTAAPLLHAAGKLLKTRGNDVMLLKKSNMTSISPVISKASHRSIIWSELHSL